MSNLYDLFKPNNYIERECATVIKQPIMLSSEEENRLENARRLDNMFGASRVVASVSQDNNVAVDVNLEYGNKGKYFQGFYGDVFINKVTKIEQNGYIPGSAIKDYLNLTYECYSIYIKHESGEDVEVARIVVGY